MRRMDAPSTAVSTDCANQLDVDAAYNAVQQAASPKEGDGAARPAMRPQNRTGCIQLRHSISAHAGSMTANESRNHDCTRFGLHGTVAELLIGVTGDGLSWFCA